MLVIPYNMYVFITRYPYNRFGLFHFILILFLLYLILILILILILNLNLNLFLFGFVLSLTEGSPLCAIC
jgi:hypothetical protein